MGFVVNEDGLVSVNHDIDDFGITTSKFNPTKSRTHCKNPMIIHSIFKRYDRNRGKEKNVNGQLVGDNCPFIYAVKKKVTNLYVNTETIRSLCKPMNEIIDKFVQIQDQNKIKYDLIIPMPSSHNIASILATRVGRKLNVSLNKTCLRKSTSGDVFKQVDGNKKIPHEARTNILDAIKRAKQNNHAFSLGDVRTVNRKYVQPLSLIESLVDYQRVLLVDDLFATGTTLITAKDLLQSKNSKLEVDALCLFSPLNGRIRKPKK